MGLFEKKKKDAERCPICGKEISFFSGLVIADGTICDDCEKMVRGQFNIEEYYGRENWKISTSDMMIWANVTEQDLYKEKEIETSFGETLSWEYLCYVREHPVVWNIPTKILYGDKDNLTSYETMSDFASKMGISLTVMNNGEHWFHTDEQMNFLDDWICESNR